MQNLSAKLLVIAIIGGGFMFTGDLGWLASRGMKVIDAADVALPSTAEERPPVEPPPAPAAAEQPRPMASPVPVPAVAPDRPQAEAGLAVAERKIPAGGPDQVAWSSLRAGERITVWLAGAGPRCLVLDMVDPDAGEAVAYEAAAVSAQGRPLAAAAPPRRVIVGRPADRPAQAVVARGGMLHLAPAGIAAAGGRGQWLGPVEALNPID